LEEVAAESLAEQELAFQRQPLEQQVLAQRGPEQSVLAQLVQALVLVPEQGLALEQLQLEHLVMKRHHRLGQVQFRQQRRYLLELKSSLIYRQQVMEFQYRLYRLRPLVTVHRVQLDHLRLLANGLQWHLY
jgi:hypothetical protein